MSSSVHVDNKKKDILILSGISTQGLDDTSLTVELNILFILRNQIKELYKVYTIMKSRISYFLMLQNISIQRKNSNIKDYTLLGNI